jgi:predicted  nucleic acid-binding Zn-ribbon protein
MTTFEEQLMSALKKGCPKCGEDDFYLYARAYPTYTVWEQDGQIHYSNIDSSGEDDVEVSCADCSAQLWTVEDGWIPELAEIVKGENNATER